MSSNPWQRDDYDDKRASKGGEKAGEKGFKDLELAPPAGWGGIPRSGWRALAGKVLVWGRGGRIGGKSDEVWSDIAVVW